VDATTSLILTSPLLWRQRRNHYARGNDAASISLVYDELRCVNEKRVRFVSLTGIGRAVYFNTLSNTSYWYSRLADVYICSDQINRNLRQSLDRIIGCAAPDADVAFLLFQRPLQNSSEFLTFWPCSLGIPVMSYSVIRPNELNLMNPWTWVCSEIVLSLCVVGADCNSFLRIQTGMSVPWLLQRHQFLVFCVTIDWFDGYDLP